MIDQAELVGITLKDRYVLEEALSGGEYGITFRGTDNQLERPVAVKILRAPNPDSSWKLEARKAARLGENEHVVQVYDFGEFDFPIRGSARKYAFIVYQLIIGQTLRQFLQSNTNISHDFILQFIIDVCDAIAAMQDVGLVHGDLHEGNIMLSNPAVYQGNAVKRVKIIDFGLSRTFLGEKYSSDIESLIRMIKQFWEKNQVYGGELIESDKEISSFLQVLIKQLEETAPDIRLSDPVQIIQKIQEFKERHMLRESKKSNPLTDPFEFLDVIEIPQDTSLLHDLFVPMPWYQELESFGNTLVSGSRGSGKSTILRYMRFKEKLHSDEFKKRGYLDEKFIGFYLHCHPSIYFPFSAKQIVYTPEISDMVLHYINLQLTYEVLDTLVTAEKFGVILPTEDAKIKLLDFINEQLQQKGTLLENMNPLVLARTLIERELKLVQNHIVQNTFFRKRTNVGYLYSLCGFLQENIAYFADKRFFFLIDDYSAHNVNFEIQRSFNRVIRSKNPKYCFKISTEKFSIDLMDFDEKQLEQKHEYHYIDLGEKFLSYPNDKEIKDFMQHVLDKRLAQAGIKMTATQIFGELKLKKNFGACLAEPELRENTLYAGFHIISMLCSGDMRTLLELCKEIFREAKWKKDDPKPIPLDLQDRVIRQFSRDQLSEIRGNYLGEDMLRIAISFGEICKKYLYEYGSITSESDRYYEMIRIEIEGVRPLQNEQAQALYKSLLKFAVFIDAGEGYPRVEELSTRLVLRRIYTPAFQISYRNAECLRLSPSDFEKFLLQPERFKRGGTRFLKEPSRFKSARQRRNRLKRMDDFIDKGLDLQKQLEESKNADK